MVSYFVGTLRLLTQTTLCVKQFWPTNTWNIVYIDAPCGYFLFPKVKYVLKRTRFESFDAVKKKTADAIKQMTESDLLHAFGKQDCIGV